MEPDNTRIEIASEEVPEDTPTTEEIEGLGEIEAHSCLLDGPERPDEAISEKEAGSEAERMETVDSLKELDNG